MDGESGGSCECRFSQGRPPSTKAGYRAGAARTPRCRAGTDGVRSSDRYRSPAAGPPSAPAPHKPPALGKGHAHVRQPSVPGSDDALHRARRPLRTEGRTEGRMARCAADAGRAPAGDAGRRPGGGDRPHAAGLSRARRRTGRRPAPGADPGGARRQLPALQLPRRLRRPCRDRQGSVGIVVAEDRHRGPHAGDRLGPRPAGDGQGRRRRHRDHLPQCRARTALRLLAALCRGRRADLVQRRPQRVSPGSIRCAPSPSG